MAASRKPLGVATRRAVTRILGSADSLPDRSKASKVLTIVACRLQLFVCELERARYEHLGLGIEQLLDRLHEHCQLLSVASVQGGGVQSGYALLSELSELLQELESSVLLLPGQLGSDARYKPALDELQALLTNVSYYRLECEDTKRRMEIALSDLVQSSRSCMDRDRGLLAIGPTTGPSRISAATAIDTTASFTGPDMRRGSGSSPSGSGIPEACGDAAVAVSAAMDDAVAAADNAVLQRVRQVIWSLDLDVKMAERDQDLDAELLQLRDQMQRSLLQQQQLLLQEQQQQPTPSPHQHVDINDLDRPYGVRQGALVRSTCHRQRPVHSGDNSAAAAAPVALPESPSGSSHSWSPSGSLSAGLALASPYGGRGAAAAAPSTSRTSRLHAARNVSRNLAAQHLARLKEQQRQLRLQNAVAAAAAAAAAAEADVATGSAVMADDLDTQPASRRRKLMPKAIVSRAAATAATDIDQLRKHGKSEATVAAAAAAVTDAPGHGGEQGGGRQRMVSPEAWTEATPARPMPHGVTDTARFADAGGGIESDPWASNAAPEQPNVPAASLKPCSAVAAPCSTSTGGSVMAAAAATVDCERGTAGAVPAALQLPGSVVARTGGGVASGGPISPEGPPQPEQQQLRLPWRPTADSVAALRKLNRVATLAGMWEAGRPMALRQSANLDEEQQQEEEEDSGGGASDCDSRSDNGGGDELPARPAPARRLPQPPQAAVNAARGPLAQLLGGGSPPVQRPTAVAVSHSPFLVLAMQGRAPKAPPPPVRSRVLPVVAVEPPPQSQPEQDPVLEESPMSPAAAASRDGTGTNAMPCSPTTAVVAAAAAATGPPGGLRIRGGGAAGPVAAAAAPAPLPLPDTSVHLRAVGLPDCFAPHWAPAVSFGLPAAVHAAGGRLWLVGGDGGGCAVAAADGGELLDFGPDVPTLDLHRDITGWGPCLGRGAFGAVYKALFRNKPAAVKVLHGGALDVRDMRSLRTEISLLCRLRHHPNIITVYGAAAAPPDHVALVTELMDCDLYDYIHRRRQNCVPLDEVLSIARAIAAGLSELHPTIVHRDLKPANVLIRHSAPPPPPPPTQQQQLNLNLNLSMQQGGVGAGAGVCGPQQQHQHQHQHQQQQHQQQQQQALTLDRRLTVKIADFGLARHKRSQYLSTRELDAGTLKYMAPECIANGGGANGDDGGEGDDDGGGGGGASGAGGGGGGGITEKCDIYSFGVLLYELITGREPWEGCHPLYAVCQVQSGVMLPLPDDPARCPTALRSLILRCWSHQHQQRPSSRELLQQLDDMIARRRQCPCHCQPTEEGVAASASGGAVDSLFSSHASVAALQPREE